ncbi:MAG: hypothetical protein ACK4MX_09700 [Thermaurantiacus sp.]
MATPIENELQLTLSPGVCKWCAVIEGLVALQFAAAAAAEAAQLATLPQGPQSCLRDTAEVPRATELQK